jgi:hypothetical protein
MGLTTKVFFLILDFLQSEGLVDEHRLAHQLAITPTELRKVLDGFLDKGYIRSITRKGTECQQCDAQLSCPSSQIHKKNPKKTFKAYQLTTAGMRYHRLLHDQQET